MCIIGSLGHEREVTLEVFVCDLTWMRFVMIVVKPPNTIKGTLHNIECTLLCPLKYTAEIIYSTDYILQYGVQNQK